MQLLSELDRRYPHNPLFSERLALAADDYLHDAAASAAAWRTLLDRALAGTVYLPQRTEIRARLGLAAKLIALRQYDQAIAHATVVANLGAAAPDSARARANELLRLARARQRAN